MVNYDYTVPQAVCPYCHRPSELPFVLCTRCRSNRKKKLTVYAHGGHKVQVSRTTTWAQFDQLRDEALAKQQVLDALTVYKWSEWPEHLLTKAQMSEAGLQTGAKLPPPAGKVRRDKSPDGWMYLYDRHGGVAKAEISAEQKAKLDAALEKYRAGWRCCQCGDRFRHWRGADRLCDRCQDRYNEIGWAQEVLESPTDYVILDTETTGLDTSADEIIQIALIDATGAVLLNTLVKALHPERMYQGDGRCAFDVHGIGADRLVDAPSWDEVWDKVQALTAGKTLLVYNAAFDVPMMRSLCVRHGLNNKEPWETQYCVMEAYAAFVGEWSRHYESYRWQPLDGGHTALEDCQAVLRALRHMARSE